MNTITIESDNKNLCAEITPDYGGMMTRLSYKGKEILAFDEPQVHVANLLAGGCPVLFPFPSKTKDDSYTLNGKEYRMPFHGLVKNSPFAIGNITKNSASLYITNSESSKRDHYPFDFTLSLKYELIGDEALFEAEVYNGSDLEMPHYFGWHHYFSVSDKSGSEMTVPMKYYKDYFIPDEAGQTDGKVDCALRQDRVFSQKTGNTARILNKADGWGADIIADNSFEAFVVCTIFDGRITCEPWLGTPDCINSSSESGYVKWVSPRSKETYRLKLKLYDL